MSFGRVDDIVRRFKRDAGDLGQNKIENPDILDALILAEKDVCRDALCLKVKSSINLLSGITDYPLTNPIYKLDSYFPPQTWLRPVRLITNHQEWTKYISRPINGLGRYFWQFDVSGISVGVQPNDVYSNNGTDFLIYQEVLTGVAPNISGVIIATGTASPQGSGTLTKVSGNGDASISFSATQQGASGSQPTAMLVWNKTLSLFPAPSASESLGIWYYGLPSTNPAFGSDPTVDDEWDDCLEFGTLERILGGTWHDRYMTELRRVKARRLNDTTMPMYRELRGND